MTGRVFVQDTGTGLESDNDQDWLDAANLMALSHSPNDTGYVVDGLGLTADFTNDEMAVSSGQCKVTAENVTTTDHSQDSPRSVGQYTWPEVTATVLVDSETVAISSTGTTEIWVDPGLDSTTPDDVSIATSQPTGPSIHIGTVDADAETVDELNRRPDGQFGDLTATTGQVDSFSADSAVIDSTTTTSMSNDIGDAAIQTAWNGLVVPVANGLGMDAAIDPSSTSTPVQDAIGAISAAAGSQGQVLLPPGSVDTPGDIQVDDHISLIGWGDTSGSQLRLTDETNPLFAVNGERSVYLDGIDCVGQGDDVPSEPALDFQSGAARSWNIGAVRFREFAAGLEGTIRLDGGAVFQSNWDYVKIEDNEGTAFRDVSSGGPANSIGTLYINPQSNGQALDLFGSGNWDIGAVNISGDVERPSEIRGNPSHRSVRIGFYNHEAGSGTLNQAINLFDEGPTQLWHVSAYGVDLREVVGLQTDTANKIIGHVSHDNGTLDDSLVSVRSEPAGPSWYFGDSSDVTNAAGTSTGYVRSLGTAGTGNG